MVQTNPKKVLHRLAGQSFLYGLSDLGAKALMILTIPVVTRCLTVSEYGILGLMGAAAGFMGHFFHLNAGVLLSNDYVRAADDDTRRRLLNTMYYFGLLSSIVWCVIGMALSGVLADVLLNAPGYGVYLRITVLTAFFSAANMVVISFLRISQQVSAYAAISLILAGVNALFTIVALVLWHVSLKTLLWIGSGVGLLGSLFYLITIVPDLRLQFHLPYAREILRLGIPAIGHTLAHWGLTSMDLFFLQRYSNSQELGIYSFAYKFGYFMNIFVFAFASAWGPHLLKIMAGPENDEALAISVTEPYKTALLLLCLIGLGLTLFAPEGIRILAPATYMQALPAIPWIILGYLFLALYYGIVNIPLFMKKHRYLPLTTGIAAFCNGLLNWWLVPKYGMMAAAVTTAISYAILFVATLFLARSSLRVPIPNLRAIWVIFLSIVCYAVTVHLVRVEPFAPLSMALRIVPILFCTFCAVQIMFPGPQSVRAIRLILSYPLRRWTKSRIDV